MVATDSRALPPSSFDVVLAGDVLHATQDIGRVLAQLRELVVPGGWLVFVEMTREHYQVMTSLELMIRLDEATGDFLDERRGRDQTFLTRAQWLDAIEAAGGERVLLLPRPHHLVAELGIHFFDALLRRILEGPTIAALASALTREAEAVEEADAERPSPLVHRGGSGDGAALVLVHGADGTIGPLEELVPELTERARIVTLTVADAAAYLALDPSVLVERTAADYARLLLDDGLSHVHLVGAGFGGLLAAEVARQLAETGADVEGVTVVAAEPPPPDAAFAEQAARAAEAHELGAYAGDVTLVTPPDDASLARFCDGCRVVLDCTGPSFRVLDRVARAALRAGADYVGAGGDEPAYEALARTRLRPGRTAVVSAGMMPGLSGLLPRSLAAVADLDGAPEGLLAYAGGGSPITPPAAADHLPSPARGFRGP